MTDTTDKIVMIDLDQLEPHDYAERFWPEGEEVANDREAIFSSVAEMGGVENPLLVTPKENGDGYWVVDGCARLEGAKRAGLLSVKSRVRDMTLEEIQDTVFINNMVRRRFTAGQRVMRYLENHLTDVLDTARENADPAVRGAKGGRGNKAVVADHHFSREAIAARIGTSDKDVRAGIELLRCKVEGLKVRGTGADRRLVAVAGDNERDAIGNTYDSVIRGETPIRRWAASLGGKEATSGKAKAPTNHPKLGIRSLKSVKTVFESWQQIGMIDRDTLLNLLDLALDAAPEDVVSLLVKRYGTPDKTGRKAK